MAQKKVLPRSNQLTLENISRKDSGNYSCTVANVTTNPKDNAIATVTVLYAPAINFSTPNLTVNESSKTQLTCKVSGNPLPLIRWTLPNGSRVRNSGLLEFDNTTRSQHGKYACQASNKIGNSSVLIYLNVQYRPMINKTGRDKKIDSWLNHSSILTCKATGNPQPEIIWLKDDRLLFNGSTTGNIKPQSESDFGIYTCLSRNVLGNDSFKVHVNRTAFPPGRPEIRNKQRHLNNRSFVLYWSQPDERGRPIFRYWVWILEEGGNSSEKDVGNFTNHNFTLKWDKSYNFSVVAENDQGKGTKSLSKIFITPPEPTTPFPTPTATTEIDQTEIPVVLISAITGGVGFLLIIVIAAFCFKTRRRRRRAQAMQPLVDLRELQANFSTKTSAASPSTMQHNTYNAVPPPRIPKRNGTRPRESELAAPNPSSLAIYTNVSSSTEDEKSSGWEFPRDKVHIQKYVGKGAFCVVAKAFAEGLGTVAVKIPKEKAPDSNKKDLLAEYELMKQLQPHPNVIRLMGAVTLSDPIMVLFEYIPYGDLLGFLRRSRGLDDKYYKDPDVKPSSSLTSQQLLRFAQEIADGMAFLAANKIIHRDLAARNVLVGEEEICKITDFGMARDVQQTDIYQKRTKSRLPVKWTAMESLLYGLCTSASDVWSYGIVLYEIFTIGGKPYPNLQAHRLPYLLKENYRMPKPAHLDDDIYALMCQCWVTEPERRPSFDSIGKTIKRLQQCHKEVIYMNVYDENLYGNVEDWD
ncbi:unnamed protein product [Porites lobata]|uniref:receptor protein-tyrosine kinase n=1 Tax=Porites lobata TaxID=104759 RepID=A0ABN8Q7B1_9CNID|nr:unnamed protein product [Porites lobata]